MSKKERQQIRHLWHRVDLFLAMIQVLRMRVEELEKAKPDSIYTVAVKYDWIDNPRAPAKVDHNPERFEKEWTRQAEFCGE